MVDYKNAVIKRLTDKKSPGHINLMDRIRSFFIRKFNQIDCHNTTIFKKSIQITTSKANALKIGKNCVIHERVSFLLTLPNPNVNIGDSVYIGRDTIIASKNSIEIGSYTVFAPRCYIIDHEHGFNSNELILNQRSVLKKIKIGRDCYFGAGVVILGGVTIGDGVVIGANSVITKDIPNGYIGAGNPVKFIKSRSN
jgi:acetyltransferase-like isoleucine patch superfamily enzyme|tara:strand:+ start:337 stop:924 length:588 start_codon:yes stop_codon:yes gene_type:complete